MVAANPEVLRLGYKILASERGMQRCLCQVPNTRRSRLFCRAVWENHPYGCALAKDALRFDPATVQLGDVLHDR